MLPDVLAEYFLLLKVNRDGFCLKEVVHGREGSNALLDGAKLEGADGGGGE